MRSIRAYSSTAYHWCSFSSTLFFEDASLRCGTLHEITQEGQDPVSKGRVQASFEDSLEPLHHQGCTLWLTGLSGAGKTTTAKLLEQRLRACGRRVEVLDGDLIRENLTKGLGFSKEDRDENVRRIGFVCLMLSRNGVIAIAAAISPYRETRERLRQGISCFVEVYMECPLDVVIQRDVKGLYRKALAGEISNFTGVSDPYEPPLSPDVTIHSSTESPEEGVDKIWAVLQREGLVPG